MPELGAAQVKGFYSYRRSDQYYSRRIVDATFTTFVNSLNTIYLTPFVVIAPQKFDRIGFYVSTPGAGSVRLGIYDDTGLVYPKTVIFDAGLVSVSTTGFKTITIDKILPPGLCWLAMRCGVSFTGRTAPLGSLDTTVLGSDGYDGWDRGYERSQIADALPTPFPSGESVSVSLMTDIYLRAAT